MSRRPLDVDCPKCIAKAGQSCWGKRPDGRSTGAIAPHRGRVLRAARAPDAAVEQAFGACPWCAAPISVALTPDGAPAAVLHPRPMCARFAGSEADEYLRDVLDYREAERAGH